MRVMKCDSKTALVSALVVCVGLACGTVFAADTPAFEVLGGGEIGVDIFGAQRAIVPHTVSTAPSALSGVDLRSTGVIEFPRVSTAFEDYLDVFQNKAFRLDIDTAGYGATLEFDGWLIDRDENLVEVPITLTTGSPSPSIVDCGGIPICFPGSTESYCYGREWDPLTGELKLVGVALVPFESQSTVECAVISFEIEARVFPADPDGDTDDDGVPDIDDSCPGDTPSSQIDGDGDGIGDVCDNCLAEPNPDQTDRDLDGIGDACQPLRVNYQPAASAVPAGYVADDGSTLGVADTYGWLGSPAVTTVERGIDPDQRIDTFAETGVERRWEAVLPPMRVDLESRIGDPALPQGPQAVVAEGVALFDDVQTAAGMHPLAQVGGVPVPDGRLSLDVGGAGGQTVLDELVVAESADQPFVVRAVNFQPAASMPPPGFVADSGGPYDPVAGYGWTAGTLASRDRLSIRDRALATFVFTVPPAEFRLDLPADYYLVKLASGDGTYAQGPHDVDVEGEPWIDGQTTVSGEFIEVVDRVLVTDRSLDVSIGGSGQTMLNYLTVMSLPADLDGDGVRNVPDNCLDVPNPGQEDVDGDGIGDVCNDAVDGDGDNWADDRDNCVSVPNPSQADGDGDGRGDPCDCAPNDDGAFALPTTVGGLALTGGGSTFISWSSQRATTGDDTLSDVLESGLVALRDTGSFAAASCLADGAASTNLTDVRIPPVGDGFVYLVRAENACGIGSWGDASGVSPDPRDALDTAGPCP